MHRPTVGEATPGFYGKVHTHGDFVLRDLPQRFVAPWDRWLRESMGASRAQLGEAWLDRYLVCPVWRFALAPGLCGEPGWVGLWMPSVDRVGRYFPLTLAAAVSPVDVTPCFAWANDWFTRAVGLLLGALEDDFDLDRFHEDVRSLGIPTPPAGSCAPATVPWMLRAAHETDLGQVLCGMAPGLLAAHYAPASLWWAESAGEMGRRFLAWRGLPGPKAFSAFLDEHWEADAWGACPHPPGALPQELGPTRTYPT